MAHSIVRSGSPFPRQVRQHAFLAHAVRRNVNRDVVTSMPTPAANVLRRPPWLLLALPLASGLFAYGGALTGELVHDDATAVGSNALRTGDWWRAAFGEPHTPSSGRPLPCLTFAWNAMLGADSTFGHHAVNLAFHLLNVLLLLGIVRRTLQAPNLSRAWTDTQATWIATAIATVFACHPLGVDAVVYITQRTTLMMSFCFLAAIYCVLRSHTAAKRWRWDALAVIALALGMGCKEELAAAPILVVLFERAFLLPSFAAARPRLGFYACLVATWAVLIACVVAAPYNSTAGYQAIERVSAVEWLQTEARIVVTYARLALWPQGMRTVYDWPIVRSIGPALVPGSVILVAIVSAVWAWRRTPWWSWLGALFFLLLAPTSTVFPIVTEVAAERRAYLPMLAVIVPAWLGAHWAFSRLGKRFGASPASTHRWLLAAAVALAVFAIMHTRERARAYQDEWAVWSDAVRAGSPDSRSLTAGKILTNYAHLLRQRGRTAEAHEACDRALQCELLDAGARVNCGVSLMDRGRTADAERELRRALRDKPGMARAAYNLALLLAEGAGVPPDAARLAEANTLATDLLQREPTNSAYHFLHGVVLAARKQVAEAEAAFRRASEITPGAPQPYGRLAMLFLQAGRLDDAAGALQAVVRYSPQDVGARMQLADTWLRLQNPTAAKQQLREILTMDPNHAAARSMLDQLDKARR